MHRQATEGNESMPATKQTAPCRSLRIGLLMFALVALAGVAGQASPAAGATEPLREAVCGRRAGVPGAVPTRVSGAEVWLHGHRQEAVHPRGEGHVLGGPAALPQHPDQLQEVLPEGRRAVHRDLRRRHPRAERGVRPAGVGELHERGCLRRRLSLPGTRAYGRQERRDRAPASSFKSTAAKSSRRRAVPRMQQVTQAGEQARTRSDETRCRAGPCRDRGNPRPRSGRAPRRCRRSGRSSPGSSRAPVRPLPA